MVSNLYVYELLIGIFGILLFIFLCIVLVRLILRNKKWGYMLLLFFIPIFMMGYPVVKEVHIDNGKIELKKIIFSVQTTPDTTTIEGVPNFISRVNERAYLPEDFHLMSQAYLLYGKSDSAISFAKKAQDHSNNNDDYSHLWEENYPEIPPLESIIELAKVQEAFLNKTVSPEKLVMDLNKIESPKTFKTVNVFREKYNLK